MAISDKEIIRRLRNVRDDPWYFLSNCVYTKDQVDKESPVKKFPAHLEYLKLYVRIWEREMRLVVPKSRRMFMTWCNIALYGWDTYLHKGRLNAFVSKKEEDADEILQRTKFILESIPDEFIPKEARPQIKYKYCHLMVPEIDSKIQAFPSGADQLRQFTFSGILADEMAFWDNAEDMYSGSVPTLEGGGRFTGISSAGPGFFKRIVFDQLDQAGS